MTYHVTCLIKALMLRSVPRTKRSILASKNPISVIEIQNPVLMRRIIALLVQIDLVQLLFVAAVLQLVSRLGFVILVEDFAPTIMVDHNTYLKTYGHTSVMDTHFIRRLHELVRSFALASQGGRSLCVYLWSTEKERQKRSEARGFRIADISTLHDSERGEVLRSSLPCYCRSVLNLDTTAVSPETIAQRIVRGIPPPD
jgi:hypothetical protein